MSASLARSLFTELARACRLRGEDCPPVAGSLLLAPHLCPVPPGYSAPLAPSLGETGGDALAAVDAFIAAPTPASYLTAVRGLRAARKHARVSKLLWARAQREFESGLESLADLPEVGAALAAALGASPVDRKQGARLQALWALISTHRELEARADAATRELRLRLRRPERRAG